MIHQSEAKFLTITFMVVYVLAIPFIILVLIFVNCVLHEPDCCVCKKLSPQTQKYLFLSTASSTWIILGVHMTLTIFFMIVTLLHVNCGDEWFMTDKHYEYHYEISYLIKIVVIIHGIIVIPVTSVLLLGCCYIGVKAYRNRPRRAPNQPANADPPANQQVNIVSYSLIFLLKHISLTSLSTAAMIFFAFTFFWEMISLIPHLVLFPYRTLCIIVQYIGFVFLLNCFMYHALTCCSNYKRECSCNKGKKWLQKIRCYTQEEEEEDDDWCCCCACEISCRSVGQASIALFSLMFLL